MHTTRMAAAWRQRTRAVLGPAHVIGGRDTASGGEPAWAALPAEAQRLAGELRLMDGQSVRTRPITASDTAKLQAFHASLSRETIALCFFGALPVLPQAMAEHFTQVDYADRMALLVVADADGDERILAVGRYDRIGPTEAEVAFVVHDAWQGHGIATALLARLASYARRHGIATFVAYVLEGNLRMLDVLRHSGYPSTARLGSGELEVRLDISRASSPLSVGHDRDVPAAG